MKKLLRWIVLGVGVLSSSLLPTQSKAQTTTPVAVVDIGHIFKTHPRYTAAMEAIKRDVQVSDEGFRKRGGEIEAKVKQLQALRADSPDFKQLEAETAQLQARLEADMALKRKEFLEKEAKLFFAIYQEVQNEVRDFADNNGIGLVLRFSDDDIDPADRASVLQGVNRPVVYQRDLNITNAVLERLQRKGGGESGRTASRPAATPNSAPKGATAPAAGNTGGTTGRRR